MEEAISFDILNIQTEGDSALPVLYQVGESFKMVVFNGHEKNIFLFFVLNFHVGSVSLQKVDHLDVAV